MKNRIFVTIFLFLITSSFACSSAAHRTPDGGEKITLRALNSMERIGQNQKLAGDE